MWKRDVRICIISRTKGIDRSLEERMDVVIERDGVVETIRYWPRSYTKAEGWQMVKREEKKDVPVQ